MELKLFMYRIYWLGNNVAQLGHFYGKHEKSSNVKVDMLRGVETKFKVEGSGQ